MSTQTTQLRVTLPVQLQGYLQTKANKFGLSLSSYVRNLIINDVQDVEYPVFEASERTEKAYKKAMKEKAHATEINDLDNFFDKL